MQSKKLLSALLAFVLVAICTVGFLMLGVNAEAEPVAVVYNVTGETNLEPESGLQEDKTYETLQFALEQIAAKNDWATNEFARVLVSTTEVQALVSTDKETYSVLDKATGNYSDKEYTVVRLADIDNVQNVDGENITIEIEGNVSEGTATIQFPTLVGDNRLQPTNNYTFRNVAINGGNREFHAAFATIEFDTCTLTNFRRMSVDARWANHDCFGSDSAELIFNNTDYLNIVYIAGATGWAGSYPGTDHEGADSYGDYTCTLTVKGTSEVTQIAPFQLSDTPSGIVRHFVVNIQDSAKVGKISSLNSNDFVYSMDRKRSGMTYTLNMTGGEVGAVGFQTGTGNFDTITHNISAGTITANFSGANAEGGKPKSDSDLIAGSAKAVINNISGGEFQKQYYGAVGGTIETVTNNISSGTFTTETFYGVGAANMTSAVNNLTGGTFKTFYGSSNAGEADYKIGSLHNIFQGVTFAASPTLVCMGDSCIIGTLVNDFNAGNTYNGDIKPYATCNSTSTKVDVTESVTTNVNASQTSKFHTLTGVGCTISGSAYVNNGSATNVFKGARFNAASSTNRNVGGNYTVNWYGSTMGGSYFMNANVGGDVNIYAQGISGVGNNAVMAAGNTIGGDLNVNFTSCNFSNTSQSDTGRTVHIARGVVSGDINVEFNSCTIGTWHYFNLVTVDQPGNLSVTFNNTTCNYAYPGVSNNIGGTFTQKIVGKIPFSGGKLVANTGSAAKIVNIIEGTSSAIAISDAYVGPSSTQTSEVENHFVKCNFASDFCGAGAGVVNVSNYFDGCTFGGKVEFATEKTLENLSTGWANKTFSSAYTGGNIDPDANEYVVTGTLTNNLGAGAVFNADFAGNKALAGKVVNNVAGAQFKTNFYGTGGPVGHYEEDVLIPGDVENNVSTGSKFNTGKASAFYGSGLNETVATLTNTFTGATFTARTGNASTMAGADGCFYGNGGPVTVKLVNNLYGGAFANNVYCANGALTCPVENTFGNGYAPEGLEVDTATFARVAGTGGKVGSTTVSSGPVSFRVNGCKNFGYNFAVKGSVIVPEDWEGYGLYVELLDYSTNSSHMTDGTSGSTINGDVKVVVSYTTTQSDDDFTLSDLVVGGNLEVEVYDMTFLAGSNFRATVGGKYTLKTTNCTFSEGFLTNNGSANSADVTLDGCTLNAGVTFACSATGDYKVTIKDTVVTGDLDGVGTTGGNVTYDVDGCEINGLVHFIEKDVAGNLEIDVKNTDFTGSTYIIPNATLGGSLNANFEKISANYFVINGKIIEGDVTFTANESSFNKAFAVATQVDDEVKCKFGGNINLSFANGRCGWGWDIPTSSQIEIHNKDYIVTYDNCVIPATLSSSNNYRFGNRAGNKDQRRFTVYKDCSFIIPEGWETDTYTTTEKVLDPETGEVMKDENGKDVTQSVTHTKEKYSMHLNFQGGGTAKTFIYGNTVVGNENCTETLQLILTRGKTDGMGPTEVYFGSMPQGEDYEPVVAATTLLIHDNAAIYTGLENETVTASGKVYYNDVVISGTGIIANCLEGTTVANCYTYVDGNITIDPSLGLPKLSFTGVYGDSATVTLAEGYGWEKDQAYVHFTSADELAKIKGRTLGETFGYAKRDNVNLALVGATMTAPSVTMEVTDRISLNLLLVKSEVDDFNENAAMINWANDDGFWFRVIAGDYADDILVEGEITAATETWEDENDVVYYKVSMGTLPAHRFGEVIELQGSTFCINQIGEGADLTVLNLALEGAKTFEKAEDKTLAKAIYAYGFAAMDALDIAPESYANEAKFAEDELNLVDTDCSFVVNNKATGEVKVNNVSLLMGDAMGIRFSTNAAFAGKEVKVYLNGSVTTSYAMNAERGYFDIFVSADEIDTEFTLVITIDGETAMDATMSMKGVVEMSYNANKTDARVEAFAQLAQACYNYVVAPVVAE